MINIPTSHRFISVLSKKIETGRALNALGHMTAGLISLFEGKFDQFRFQTYIDGDKSLHMNISDNPFIVLKADNSNKIRTLRNELLARNIVFTDFKDTMIEGTFVEQHARTNLIKADLEYFGITFFADNETSKELTKKFSLYL